ncbi:MAG: hypothetical protein U1E76_10195 [Planctomycetota bacterium]
MMLVDAHTRLDQDIDRPPRARRDREVGRAIARDLASDAVLEHAQAAVQVVAELVAVELPDRLVAVAM